MEAHSNGGGNKVSILLTADWHLTDHPKDSYRWGLIPWIQEQVQKCEISQVAVLGDIVDSKDRHSAKLVNKLISQLTELANHCDVYILYGNHDGLEADSAFFGFIESFDRNIYYINKPTAHYLGSDLCLFLPSTRNHEIDWAEFCDPNQYTYIFCHQTFTGAKSETGMELTGVPPSVFSNYKGRVISGDIHVPQRLNKTITYVGSPYLVRFGDSFTPRVMVLGDKPARSSTDLRFPCLSKFTLVVTSAEELLSEAAKHNVKEGDQVKVRVRLPRTQYGDWNQIKEQIRTTAVQKGWDLFGPELLPLSQREKAADSVSTYRSPEAILKDYAKQKRFNEAQIAAGLRLLG